jgi:hypothetical protein
MISQTPPHEAARPGEDFRQIIRQGQRRIQRRGGRGGGSPEILLAAAAKKSAFAALIAVNHNLPALTDLGPSKKRAPVAARKTPPRALRDRAILVIVLDLAKAIR